VSTGAQVWRSQRVGPSAVGGTRSSVPLLRESQHGR